ncbi:MAG: hypothetical protein RMJ33_06925 [Saprospiraceae bacterium]|nr:cytochrome c [Saprospiraceae bacterium]MDW8229554.1 hypothetical protein [Saprospiraceae bacterium]
MRISLISAASLLLLAVIAFLSPACTYDNEEDLYGNDLTGCDTVGMRFSVEVKAVFDANCARCHVPGSPQYSGIAMGTHAQMENFAKNGKLVGRINNASSPMPPSGLMAACDRARIEAWVRAGAPNN